MAHLCDIRARNPTWFLRDVLPVDEHTLSVNLGRARMFRPPERCRNGNLTSFEVALRAATKEVR